MLSLVAALGFVGYTLVYAAVANKGAFARTPWRAMYEDAYGAKAGVDAVGGSSQSWWEKALGIIGDLANPAGAIAGALGL